MRTDGTEGLVQRGLAGGQTTLFVIHLGVAHGHRHLVAGCLEQVGVFGGEMIGLRMGEGEHTQHRRSTHDGDRQGRADLVWCIGQVLPALVKRRIVDQRRLALLGYPTGKSAGHRTPDILRLC